MDDDQSTQNESAVSFSERVTIDTLTDRLEVPSFDTSLEEWKPEMALRLEAILQVPGTGFEQAGEKGQRVVVILGQAEETLPHDIVTNRPMVVYNLDTGTRYDTGIQERTFCVKSDPGSSFNVDGGLLIKQGELARIETSRTEENDRPTVLEVTSIKSGPLS